MGDTIDVQLTAPDITPWRQGTGEVPYLHTFDSGQDGPHVMVNAVTHGNEICGAIAVDKFLRRGLRPVRGRLSFAFVNHMAFGRFDPASPHDTRFVDEDLNRVWDGERLDGDDDSAELRRARELRATFDSVDRLLDIHSMGSKSLPLIICHGLDKERRLAREVRYPGQVVCGSGHVQGRRLIEYAPYNDPKTDKIALLVECGQHWARETATAAVDTAVHFLRATGAIGDDAFRDLVTEAAPPPQRFLEVTDGMAAKTDQFRFAERYKGFEIFPQAGSVIAHDGDEPVVTPHDGCVLIMPNHRAGKGQRVLRFARVVDG